MQILAKAEFLNPGGSVKDRVALEIIREALASGQLKPGVLRRHDVCKEAARGRVAVRVLQD